MRFRSDAQKDCYEKLSSWLTENFRERIRHADELPAFFIAEGSAILQIAIFPWGEADSVIQCRAYVVSDAEFTSDLMHYLLLQHARIKFGSFGIDDDGDIILEHSLIGSATDQYSLQAIAAMLLADANKLGDEIVARWGGQRAMEPEVT